MLSLYYRIWVDVIQRAKSIPENHNNWKKGTMIFMSTSMTMNFMLIMVVLEAYVFDGYFYYINLDFLPRSISNVISFIVLFVLPCVLINYFLIFF